MEILIQIIFIIWDPHPYNSHSILELFTTVNLRYTDQPLGVTYFEPTEFTITAIKSTVEVN